MIHPARKLIGIRFPQWSAVGPPTTAGLVDFMRGHELWRIVTENNSYGEMEALKIDRNWHGDGLLLFRAGLAELETFRKRGIAVVLTSSEGPDGGFPRVVPDNREIGRIAARHLIECNLSNIAFLARGEVLYKEEEFAPGHRVYARRRLAGFRETLADYSMAPIVHYLKGRPLWESHIWREVQTEVMAFLESLPKPCGLFAVDDSLGAVVLRAADMLGIKVPDELAIIGYGDDPNYCYATFPAMSSIPHPGLEIGFRAAELLHDQMAGKPVETGPHIVPVHSVVQRESSRILAIEDPEIRDLVAWIRRTAPHDPLRVSELAERSSLSLTSLKTRFNECLGHSPKQEIKRVRLAHLQHLLRATDLPIAEIARRMKFASPHELSRFFLAETGERPTSFRDLETHADLSRTVIFDMDGTLFDSETLYCEAFRLAYAEQGGVLDEAGYFRDHAGTTNEAIEAALTARAPAGFDHREFSRRWRNIWETLLAQHGLAPFAGVRELLEALRDDGFALAIASSSPRAEVDRCLAISGLAEFFPSRTGGDEVPEGKPDPAIYQLAAAKLDAIPANCLVVEDSTAGVAAALAAGMKVIQIAPAHVPRAPGSLHFAETMAVIGPHDVKRWLAVSDSEVRADRH